MLSIPVIMLLKLMTKLEDFQGASGAIKETRYAFFRAEGNDLYLWESWFENGKEKFNEIEYGPLVGK